MTESASHVGGPLVSVTSAFYNTGPFLLDMIRSVLAQTFTDFELVLVDDGSTDGSLELAQSVADPRVRVYSNGANRGRSYSLNRLTTLSRGQYIARMDSDDMSAPTRIAGQVEFLSQHAEVDVVGTDVIYIDRHGVPLGRQRFPTTHAEICRTPLRGVGLPHPAILARRGWFERFRYDESINLAVDLDLFLRAYPQSRFANLGEPLFYYRYEPVGRLSKQLETWRNVARCTARVCRQAGRVDLALWCSAVRYAKSTLGVLLFSAGLQRILMQRRFTALSAEEHAAHVRTLEQIRNLPIIMRDCSESPGKENPC